ncbi:MAG: endonuclease VIII [Proteobacteria bacterium]|nr:endonuclease VIII [Pseudomonadota bacterium]
MPEGPEIRRIADALREQIAGRVIDSIRFGLTPLQRWESRLTGSEVIGVRASGKAMVIRLSTVEHQRLNIYSHNQLYGRWVFCDTAFYPASKRQLRLAIDCQGKSALLYSASDIAVLDDDALSLHPFLRRLGPDVLEDTTSLAIIIERLTSSRYRNRQLGSVLTDQGFVAGLGNYLRCEILFYASINPVVRSSELDEKRLNLLAEAILELPRQSYQTAGVTNDIDRAQALMDQGSSFEDSRFYVFRRQGLPCYRCGTRIEKKSRCGQACYYCPVCQAS